MVRSNNDDIVLYFVALFVPPISVFARRGCGVELLINILLWILGWIPGKSIPRTRSSSKLVEKKQPLMPSATGVIHAWYIIHKSKVLPIV